MNRTQRAGRLRATAWITAGLFGAWTLGGCNRKADTGSGHAHDQAGERGHDHHHDDETDGGASFVEGRGLMLTEETRAALDLTTAPMEERVVPHELRLLAHVFEAGPPAKASATVPAADATDLEQHTITGAKLLRIDRSSAEATGFAELILELPATSAVIPGDFVSVDLTASGGQSMPTVPRTAVLRSASGTFVYVVNGGYLLRTAVTPGPTSGGLVEIRAGLYAGDEVVVHPVEQLWLTELRLTKGGGHSH